MHAEIKALASGLALTLLLCGCEREQARAQPLQHGHEPPEVFVVNYPLKYFSDRIGGEEVATVFPVPQDVDPPFWNPSVSAIQGFQRADLVLLNGADYAKWTVRAALPLTRLVNTSRVLVPRYLKNPHAKVHSHGKLGKHSHGVMAYTLWLNFRHAAAQARAVRDALARLRPGKKAVFEERCRALEHDLLELDRKIEDAAKRYAGRPLLASHPVYQYLAERYRLNLRSVHWEPDEAPSEEQWRALERLHREHAAAQMLWENGPLPGTRKRLRAMGLVVVVFGPCAQTPAHGDFLAVMQRDIDNFARAVSPPGGSGSRTE